MNLERIKSELGRNKAKTMVLGALVLALAGFGAKAAMELSPRRASASAPLSEQPAAIESIKSGEIEQRVQQAAALWQVMRTKRGIAAAEAFHFQPDQHSYVLIVKPRPQAETRPSETIAVAPLRPTAEQLKAQHREAIENEARGLVLHAVLMGDSPTVLMSARKTDSKPNRYGFSDEIEGFQIVQIKERSVLLLKEGVPAEISLPDATGKNK